MIKFFAFLILSLSLNTTATIACECDIQGAFLKMAPQAPLVALIKVKKYLSFKDIYGEKTAMSMEVEIIEIYKGTENRKSIIIWGDLGNLCRPYLSQFKEGQHYVIAFYHGSPNLGHPNEKKSDYAISNCGIFWLLADIKTKTALGSINILSSNPQKISFASLKSKLLKNGG